MERYEQYIGKTLNGTYQLQELIGVGGMAYVFKAADLKNKQTVAVKILNEESRGDEKAVERFVNESRTVSMLSHPNIVRITDVGEDGDEKYIVMEFVDGITLKEYIDYKKKLEWREAVYYISQVLKALGHAHEKGIIHRDVKPQNIMIMRDGVIKVTDFGIAKVIDARPITMTDKAIGTVNYISPEQASGKTVGFSSDIYSVGIMLYEMTTGKLPFIDESPMAVAMMQVQNAPQDPTELNPAIPIGLEQILLKALRKEPDDRFSSCEAMDKALSLVVNDPTTVFSDHSPTARKKKRGSGKVASFSPIIAGVTLAFFLAALGAAIAIGKKAYGEFSRVGEDVTVPFLVGEVYNEELDATLREQSFDPQIEYSRYDSEKEIGEILAQNPAGGGTRRLSEDGTLYTLTLTVNAEPGKMILDDYVNTDVRAAEIALNKLSLPYTIVKQNDDTVIEGFIIRTDPGAGTTMEEGETVTLYVSEGAKLTTVEMPSVVGETLTAAKKLLQQNDISVGEISYIDSDKEAGVVIAVTPNEGETVPKKITAADLVVSNGSRHIDSTDRTEHGDNASDKKPSTTPSTRPNTDSQKPSDKDETVTEPDKKPTTDEPTPSTPDSSDKSDSTGKTDSNEKTDKADGNDKTDENASGAESTAPSGTTETPENTDPAPAPDTTVPAPSEV